MEIINEGRREKKSGEVEEGGGGESVKLWPEEILVPIGVHGNGNGNGGEVEVRYCVIGW